jgi:hypothetical protein
MRFRVLSHIMANPANDRRTRWRLWSGSLAAIVLIYLAGVGPASRFDVPGWMTIYRPVFAMGELAPIGRPLAAYLNLWVPTSSHATYVYAPGDGVYYVCGFTLDPIPGTSK